MLIVKILAVVMLLGGIWMLRSPRFQVPGRPWVAIAAMLGSTVVFLNQYALAAAWLGVAALVCGVYTALRHCV